MEPMRTDLSNVSLKELAEQKQLNVVFLSPAQPSLAGNFRRGVINVVFCDATNGSFTIALPDAKSTTNTEFVFVREVPKTTNEVFFQTAPGEPIAQIPAITDTGIPLLTGFTAGSVLFWNGSAISQDNANFFWDDANNRLGINYNTPRQNLQVNGVDSSLCLVSSEVNGMYLYSGVDKNGNSFGITTPISKIITGNTFCIGTFIDRAIIFGVNNVEKVRIAATTGYLGVNNNNPSQAIDVTGNILASGTISAVNLSASSTVTSVTGAITTVNATTGNISTVNAGTVNANGTTLSNTIYSCTKNIDGNSKSWNLVTLEKPDGTEVVSFVVDFIISAIHSNASGTVAVEYAEYRCYYGVLMSDAVVQKRYSDPEVVTPGYSTSFALTASGGIITLTGNTPVADDEMYFTVTRK